MHVQEPPHRTSDETASEVAPAADHRLAAAPSAPAAAGGLTQALPDDPLARTLARAVSGRVLSRWWDENGKWTDGMFPTNTHDEVHRKPGEKGKTPYWVPKNRPQTTGGVATITPVPQQVAPAYVPRSPTVNWPAPDVKDVVFWVPVDDVLYSQSSISATFTDTSKRIVDAANILYKHPENIEKFPPLEVWEIGGNLVSFDNRRLWVFKHAGAVTVPVVWAANPNSARQQSKLTARGNKGSSTIRVNGLTRQDDSKMAKW